MTTASRKSDDQAEFNALAALAQREHAAGRMAEAAGAYYKIIALRPAMAEAHNNLGIILSQMGEFGQALPRFEQALALRPNYAEVHNNLGSVLLNLGRLDEAAARYSEALALWPDYAQAHYNLGNIFLKQDKLAEAAARYERALALAPDYADASYNLGHVLEKQRKLDQAAVCYEQVLSVRPDYADARYNLGNVLWKQGKIDLAAARYEQAITLRPNYAEAYYNLGNVMWAKGTLDEAAARFQDAIDFRPDYADAQWGRAACLLVAGDYERGWPAYEGRLGAAPFEPYQNLPRWTGQPLAGRSLLLLAEQGLGDTLNFLRYARLLKDQGARVVLACPQALSRLLASHPDLDELFILESGKDFPQADFYLPLPSAPGAFQTNALTIPAQVPYLWADPALTDQWRRELAAVDGFKIGIAWQGARDYGFDPWRSILLSQFAPLAGLLGVRLVSLQKGFGSEQVATVDFPVLDISGRLDEVAGPFMDTAAVICSVDLVVTADTGIAHLAGALGVPVWLALQFSPDWRWLRGRDDTPWYPTMRLFRQTTLGEWSGVFKRMADAVETRPAESASAREEKT